MDDTLAVCESASNVGSVLSDQGATGSSSLAFFTVQDMVHAYTVMDPPTYQQLVRLTETQLQLANKAVSLQCGSLRVSTGSSSGASSDNGSGVSAGSRVSGGSSKIASIRRAASWRKRAVPEGFCYTKLLKDSSAQSFAFRLGQWPTLASLLQSPASSFKSLDDLSSFRVTGDAVGVHVVDSGYTGSSLLSSFARVAQGIKTSPGTFGAVLRAAAVPLDQSVVRVGARTPVGGLLVESLPFVRPEYRQAVLGLAASGGGVDLFLLPSGWFLPLSVTNSLWLSGSSASGYEFSLRGGVHFNSFVVACAKLVKAGFAKGTFGDSVIGQFYLAPSGDGVPPLGGLSALVFGSGQRLSPLEVSSGSLAYASRSGTASVEAAFVRAVYSSKSLGFGEFLSWVGKYTKGLRSDFECSELIAKVYADESSSVYVVDFVGDACVQDVYASLSFPSVSRWSPCLVGVTRYSQGDSVVFGSHVPEPSGVCLVAAETLDMSRVKDLALGLVDEVKLKGGLASVCVSSVRGSKRVLLEFKFSGSVSELYATGCGRSLLSLAKESGDVSVLPFGACKVYY